MLEPLAISMFSQILDKNLIDFTSLLRKRASDARDEYKAKPPEELKSKFEISRRVCLDELSELTTRAITTISHQSFLQRIVTVLLDLIAESYEAKFDQELDAIKRRTNQLKSLLDRYDIERKHRERVRIIAVIVSVVALILLFGLAFWGYAIGLSVNSVVPVLLIPIPVLLWSALGSFTSLMYRFNKASDVELQDPTRWLVTRPLVGIMLGTITFLIVKLGFLATSSDVANNLGTNELIWLVAFLVGFSDRFAEGILRNIVGRLGGDKNVELFSPTTGTNLDLLEIIQSVLHRGKSTEEQDIDKAQSPKSDQKQDRSNISSEKTPKKNKT